MLLKRLDITGFKSFAKKTTFDFATPVVAIVGPNGSGKSNVAEAIRFVLGEQSMKSMRGKRGEDMIWNGSNAVPRASRAAVSIAFDNSSRFLTTDFDEVVVERVVHRDGANEYLLNGTQVRLKDIIELLAGANIGQTGHHIISQGEADKILSASPKDRREMLEDALGLKLYQYKKEESIKKLERTEENMRQVEALRREVQPHLRFLRKQVEKIEKGEEMRTAALQRYQVYLKREDEYIRTSKMRFDAELSVAKSELASTEAQVADAKRAVQSSKESERANAIVETSEALNKARMLRSDAARRSSRIEGQIEALSRVTVRHAVPASDIAKLAEEGEAAMQGMNSLDAVRGFFITFIQKLRNLTHEAQTGSGDIESLTEERDRAVQEEEKYAREEAELSKTIDAMRAEVDAAHKEEREQERLLFELTAAERETRHKIARIQSEAERLSLEEAEFTRELAEIAPLVGREVLSFQSINIPVTVSREEQEREKRDLEKMKIRLEEMGLSGGEELLKEYKEVSEREQFLEKEIGDLTQSAAQLRTLIVDLERELSKRFDEGLHSINGEFTRLFALMFDGGSASLVRVREPVRRPRLTLGGDEGEDLESGAEDGDGEPKEFIEGIDIALTIPRKRIKSLVMLSGGERALTSIALIFAMSLVNPPPFLVLDETDAALDEANSRRYGDMVRGLSERSQLMVITHNRETMSRAGILYGVTMGNDGVSKVLSVKLEEAVKVAK